MSDVTRLLAAASTAMPVPGRNCSRSSTRCASKWGKGGFGTVEYYAPLLIWLETTNQKSSNHELDIRNSPDPAFPRSK